MEPRSGNRRSERVLLSFGFAPQVLPALQLAEWLTGYRNGRRHGMRRGERSGRLLPGRSKTPLR